MRGDAERQADIMLAVTPDSFVPAEHPIRRIKPIVDAVGMTTRSGPTLILEAGPTPGCGQRVGAPPLADVVTRSR